jgi:hypothetical protein
MDFHTYAPWCKQVEPIFPLIPGLDVPDGLHAFWSVVPEHVAWEMIEFYSGQWMFFIIPELLFLSKMMVAVLHKYRGCS